VLRRVQQRVRRRVRRRVLRRVQQRVQQRVRQRVRQRTLLRGAGGRMHSTLFSCWPRWRPPRLNVKGAGSPPSQTSELRISKLLGSAIG
jgi:hypothetical protein